MNQQATLRVAIESHLAEEGFAPDGGVAERWAVTRVGPLPICIPNTAARRRAVPYHDANHVLSGYEHLLFAMVSLLAPLVGLIPFVLAVATSPAWLAEGAHRRRRAAPAQ